MLTPVWEERIKKTTKEMKDDGSTAPERKSYTPYKGPYHYTDTTKMSNTQLVQFHAQDKQ